MNTFATIANLRPNLSRQLAVFFGFVAVSTLLAIGPGRHFLDFAYNTGDQSYIPLVPVLSAMLVYRERDVIFGQAPGNTGKSAAVFGVLGLVLIGSAYFVPASSELQMALTALGLVSSWSAAFIFSFGSKSAKAAAFPLGMLFWIVPIPSAIIEGAIYFLQVGSTELVSALFRVTGVPVLRDGFIFHLPGQSIEVAKECSGIRSSLCVLLLTMVIARESLKSNVRRIAFLVSTIPIVLLKNGVRIVTLTLLAIYVDPSFLTGNLHHRGGIVFFLIGLLMLVPILKLLQWRDHPEQSRLVADRTAAASQ